MIDGCKVVRGGGSEVACWVGGWCAGRCGVMSGSRFVAEVDAIRCHTSCSTWSLRPVAIHSFG